MNPIIDMASSKCRDNEIRKEKIQKNDPLSREKWNFQKMSKRLQFSMLQGSLNPNITFLGEKL